MVCINSTPTLTLRRAVIQIFGPRVATSKFPRNCRSNSNLFCIYSTSQARNPSVSVIFWGLGSGRNPRFPIPVCIIICFCSSPYISQSFRRMSNMKKMVLKVAIDDEKSKRKAMTAVAAVEGVESVAVDLKERKITVIGDADPVCLTVKLRKFGCTELLSVGPAKEEKKAEGEKKEEKKNDGAKKDEKKVEPPTIVYVTPSSYAPYPYTVVTDDYNPSCTIC